MQDKRRNWLNSYKHISIYVLQQKFIRQQRLWLKHLQACGHFWNQPYWIKQTNLVHISTSGDWSNYRRQLISAHADYYFDWIAGVLKSDRRQIFWLHPLKLHDHDEFQQKNNRAKSLLNHRLDERGRWISSMDITLRLISSPDVPSLVDRQAPTEKTLLRLVPFQERR